MGPATGMTSEALVHEYSNYIKLLAENLNVALTFQKLIVSVKFSLENQHEKCFQFSTLMTVGQRR